MKTCQSLAVNLEGVGGRTQRHISVGSKSRQQCIKLSHTPAVQEIFVLVTLERLPKRQGSATVLKSKSVSNRCYSLLHAMHPLIIIRTHATAHGSFFVDVTDMPVNDVQVFITSRPVPGNGQATGCT